jgi:PAS domain-containing protein
MISMKKVCAWCNKQLSQDVGQSDDMISHGICNDCRDYFFSPQGPPSFAKFLDMLDVPVLVVDDDVKVVAANEKARSLLGKSSDDLADMYLGEAIECPYARLPGGCGSTVHCRSCAIRLTVLDTYLTGRSNYDVQAYKDVCFDGGTRNISFLISTVKSGEFVYLKIHEIKGDEREQEKAA